MRITSLRLRLIGAGLVLLVVVAPRSWPKETVRLCGTHRDRIVEDLHLHQKAARQRAGRGGGIGLQSATAREPRRVTRAAGNLVLMEDADGVVSRLNDFDLDRRTLSFFPEGSPAAGYRIAAGGPGYDAAAAAAGTLLAGLGDDDAREIDLPFAFPFFGGTHQSVYVNSDGSLTFGRSDVSTLPRSLDRITAGPPRIAPLFRDLDPTRARDGVRVLTAAGQVVVSWVEVPEFSEGPRGPLQTFQARLSPDGRIDFAFNGIDTLDAIVAISPGGLQGETRVVPFSEGSPDLFTGTVAERFTRVQELDYVLASQKFYEENDDAYDYLVFFNNFGLSPGPSTVAFEVTVRNFREGIGDPPADFGPVFGSPRRLQAVMVMGPLSQYPDDPNGIVASRAPARDTPLTVLGHEAGHLFLAFASVRDPRDPDARPMLGRDGAHWSFVFNSEASLLEGNRICDRERETCPPGLFGGSRFVTTATVEAYSPLDQYLMGFRPPWEVPDMFLVEDAGVSTSQMPRAGVDFNGRRRDIRIDELVAAEGVRRPDHTVAQRHFRLAFVLVHRAGQEPSALELEKLDRFRREFDAFYRRASNERASIETVLLRSLSLSAFPATGVLVGGTATARLSLEAPAPTDLEVVLTSAQGGVSMPASVRIPAGGDEATFAIAGAREGVDEITAEIPGGGYEAARARVQVLGSAGTLRVIAVSGDKQVNTPGTALPEPIVVRVVDANNVPYAGLTLRATSSAGGAVSPLETVTDAAGEAVFRWTPAGTLFNELTVAATGAPGAAPLVVTTTGTPFFSPEAVVNAASFTPVLSPGSLATIFGANLAAGATAQGSLPLPTELAGVRVLLNGSAVPLVYVSDRQINFLLPLSAPLGPSFLLVSTALGESARAAIEIGQVSPAVFVIPGTGEGAVAVAGSGIVTSGRPAAPGDFIEIYATGLGPVEPLSPGSELRKTVSQPSVAIDGVLLPEIQFSGLAPGFAGLYQVNARVAGGVPPGRRTLTLSIGGVAANPVDIFIR